MKNIYKKKSILFVDDELHTRNIFNFSFKKDFLIILAENPSQAEEILKEKYFTIAVIVSDYKFPGDKSGTDFLKECMANYPDIIRILTTSHTENDIAINAINSCGVFRFISKPWDMDDMRKDIIEAIEFYDTQEI